MTFEQASQLTASEKVTLVKIDSLQIVKLFQLHAGSIYSRVVDYFVTGVIQNGTYLTKVNSLGAVTSGTFFYSITEKKVYVQMTSNNDPKLSDVSLVYTHFFSNAPYILPYDLTTGDEVEWLPYINSIGSVGQQLDDENTGIVLESNSTIDLINTDGYFDNIFDTHIWENKTVSFYAWFKEIAITEAQKIFEGNIESKDFATDKIVFKVKDFVYRLRNFVDLPPFTTSDEINGKITDSILGTPKRRIYGQVKQATAIGVSNTLDGYPLAGTITTTSGSATLTGTGTSFLSELSPNDEITFVSSGTTYKYGIDSITSNTSATLNKNADVTAINVTATNAPEVPYRNRNRYWHVAGHKLREPTTTITSVVSNNRFILADISDLYADDNILINGSFVQIRRISGNELVTKTAVSPVPLVGDTVKKLPIQNVYFGTKEFTYGSDWTYTNVTECRIQFNSLAEFNNTQERSVSVNVTFTNGSSSITTTATTDFRTFIKPRDWIKKNSIVSGEGDWYEVLEVKEQSIKIRSNYTGTTATTSALVKPVNYIQDDSLITVNCLGMEDGGAWIKTPASAVRHLLLNDADFVSVNEASFTQANADCDYILSVIIPKRVGDKEPTIRDVITDINESVFGSLYGSSSLQISYSILNSEKPEAMTTLGDDDILSFSTESKPELYNSIAINYRPFVDHNTGDDTTELVSYNSGFVDSKVGVKNKLEKTVYLYEEDKALIIAQRLALFKSLSNTTVSLKSKMNLFTKSVNDKIMLNLDRLFKRFGGNDRRKVGIISGIRKAQTEVDVTISDLGNIFNRVPSIAPNTASEYASASSEDKARWGYVVDNDTLTPNASSEESLGNNIIG